jgi:hypothetical protein
MKFLIMKFSPTYRHFIPLRSQYSPQHPALKRLREEHRLRVFENRVLRRIFPPKRDEMTGKLQNEEFRNV